VTVVFCDVVGSTALGGSVDLEALQGLLARYFERMKGIVDSHGGSVEKFISDAVMAVFGVPVAHEDDALRACRAAVEMRDALPELGVEGRIGVNTGEVLTGTEERLATGDAVNVAARLEQAAQPSRSRAGRATSRRSLRTSERRTRTVIAQLTSHSSSSRHPSHFSSWATFSARVFARTSAFASRSRRLRLIWRRRDPSAQWSRRSVDSRQLGDGIRLGGVTRTPRRRQCGIS